MAAPDLPVLGSSDRSLKAWRLPHLAPWLVGVGAIVVGSLLVVIGTAVLTHATVWPRAILALGGLWIAWRGIDAMCRARWGPRFPTGLWVAALWVGVLAVLVLFANLLPLQSPKALPQNSSSFTRPDLFSAHPLGTDALGRDLLSRVIYGARPSLFIGVGATAVGLAVGTTIGLIAGFYHGWIEHVSDLMTDSLLAFPPLVFLLALVSVFRPSLETLFAALGLLTVPTVIRLARGQTYAVSSRPFVVAARSMGARNRRIVFRHILPNILPPLQAFSMVLVASLIIGEASLSFLGLGIQQPAPSWGNMIADAQNVLQQHPHTMLVPAAALFLTVTAFNRLGDRGRAKAQGTVL